MKKYGPFGITSRGPEGFEMAFDAGAAIAQVILDSSGWTSGAKSMESSSSRMKQTMGGIINVGLQVGKAIFDAGKSAVLAADDFQKGFGNVSTLVDTAAVDVQGMAKGILQLDGALGDTKDLTKALYTALSASVEPANAVKFVGESAEFAKASMISTEKAVDLLSTTVNAYGAENLSAADSADKLFTIIKLGKTDGKQLTSTIGKVIPLAANMGVSLDEVGASMAIMTRQGVKSSEATTQLNALMTGFLRPSTGMKEALSEIGFESGSAAVEQLGLKGALDAVAKTTGGTTDEMAKLFSNQRGLRGAVALTGEAAKDFDSVLKEIANSSGASREAFEKQEVTFETFNNQMGKIEVIVGNVGKKFVDELAVGATEAANSMIDFLLSGKGAQIVADVLGNISGGFEVLKGIATPIINVLFKTGKDIFNEIASVIEDVAGGAGDAGGAFNILGGATALVTSTFKVLGKFITSTIDNIGNLIVAIQASGNTVDIFFQFLTGKAKWDEVENNAAMAADAFQKFATEGVANTIGIFETVFEEIDTFDDRMNKTAKEVEIGWTVTSTRTKQSILNNWGELTTGVEAMGEQLLTGAEIIQQKIQEGQTTTTTNAALSAGQRLLILDQEKSKALAIWQRMLEEKNTLLEESAQMEIERAEMLRAEYQKTADTVLSTFTGVISSTAQAIAAGEDGWEAFKSSGLNAIASILEAFGAQWAAQAAAMWAAVAGGNVALVGGAIGMTAAAAGGYAAAGVVRGLYTGGVHKGLAVVGEQGPELVNLGDTSRVISNRDSAGMMSESPVNVYVNAVINNPMDVERVSRQLGQGVRKVRRAT